MEHREYTAKPAASATENPTTKAVVSTTESEQPGKRATGSAAKAD
jgi:hypothetical protein